jgi:hypothetical protein
MMDECVVADTQASPRSGDEVIEPPRKPQSEEEQMQQSKPLNLRIVRQVEAEWAGLRLHPFEFDKLTLKELHEINWRLQELADRLNGPWSVMVNLPLTTPDQVMIHQVNVGHACEDGGCPYLVNYRQMYICLLSGKMHLCTDTACEMTEANYECRSCPLTCKVYPLEFAWTYEDGDRGSARAMQTNVKSVGGTTKQQNRRRREAATDTKASATRFTDISDDRKLEVVSFMSKYLTADTLSSKKCWDLAGKILELFRDYCSICTPAMDYTREVHTYVMLRIMASGGLSDRGYEFVSPDADVSRAISIDVAKCLVDLGNKSVQFITKQTTRFKRITVLHAQAEKKRIAKEMIEAEKQGKAQAKLLDTFLKHTAIPPTPSLRLVL